MKTNPDIPRYFCWTRFGTEAAQTISEIIERKEEERRAAGGVFLWGVGNAVGQSVLRLLGVSDRPYVLFSSIKSPPKPLDVNPPAVVAWTDARGVFNEPFALPEHALVTSRFDPASRKRVHYALVCYSEKPLALSSGGLSVRIGQLRNLVTQRPVGASQVTAVVEYGQRTSDDSAVYEVAIRACLVPPYFLRLHHPIALSRTNEGTGTFDFAAARAAIVRRTLIAGPRQIDLALA